MEDKLQFLSKPEIEDGIKELQSELSAIRKQILSVKYLFDHTDINPKICNDDLIRGFDLLKTCSSSFKECSNRLVEIKQTAIEDESGQTALSDNLQSLAYRVGALKDTIKRSTQLSKSGIDALPYDTTEFNSNIQSLLKSIDEKLYSLSTEHAHCKNLNTQQNDQMVSPESLMVTYDHLHKADEHRNEASWILNSSEVSVATVKLELSECVWHLNQAEKLLTNINANITKALQARTEQDSVNL